MKERSDQKRDEGRIMERYHHMYERNLQLGDLQMSTVTVQASLQGSFTVNFGLELLLLKNDMTKRMIMRKR